jgi:hypothetical protein
LFSPIIAPFDIIIHSLVLSQLGVCIGSDIGI